MRFIIFLFVLILTGCGGGNAAAEANVEKNAMIVPAYFYDSGLWDKLINAPDDIDYVVIVNPDNGPGDSTDENYSEWIHSLSVNGKKSVGYVYSSYANRDLDDVYSDIDTWIDLYPEIGGFFIDEVNDSLDAVNYYEDIYRYIKDKGDYYVVLNPGTTVDSAFFDISDNVVVYESDDANVSDDVCSLNSEKSSVIIYDLNSTQMQTLSKLNCRFKYFTDDNGSNPYDSLPSYFYEEIEDLK